MRQDGMPMDYHGFPGSGGYRHHSGAAATTNTETTEEDDDGGARAVKKARLVWTPELHRRFEEAVQKLGNHKAVPKSIMKVGAVSGIMVVCCMYRVFDAVHVLLGADTDRLRLQD